MVQHRPSISWEVTRRALSEQHCNSTGIAPDSEAGPVDPRPRPRVRILKVVASVDFFQKVS